MPGYFERVGYSIAAVNEAARAKTISALASQIRYIYNDLVKNGFPAGKTVTTYAIALIMLETDWMTSNVANVDNNYSGITWTNKPYQDATRGLPKPEGGYYAHFTTFEKWIKDFLRILSLNTGGKGRPIDAQTAQQFTDRLKANGYFADPNYGAKHNAALRKVSEAINFSLAQDKKFLEQRGKGQDTFTYAPGQGLTNNTEFDLDRWWKQKEAWAKEHPLVAAGIVALTLFGVKKIME